MRILAFGIVVVFGLQEGQEPLNFPLGRGRSKVGLRQERAR